MVAWRGSKTLVELGTDPLQSMGVDMTENWQVTLQATTQSYVGRKSW